MSRIALSWNQTSDFDSFDIFKYLLTLNIPSHKNEKIQVECLLDSLEEGGYVHRHHAAHRLDEESG